MYFGQMKPGHFLFILLFLFSMRPSLILMVESRPNNRMRARTKTRQKDAAAQTDSTTSATTTATPTTNYFSSRGKTQSSNKYSSQGVKTSSSESSYSGKKSSGKKSNGDCGSVTTGTQSFLVTFSGNPFDVTDIELALAGGAFSTTYNELAGVGCNIPAMESATIAFEVAQQGQQGQPQQRRNLQEEESIEFGATITAEYTCTGLSCQDFFYSSDADENINNGGKKGKKYYGGRGKLSSSSKSGKRARRSRDPRFLRNRARGRNRDRVKTSSTTDASTSEVISADNSDNVSTTVSSNEVQSPATKKSSGNDGSLPTMEEFIRAYDDDIQLLVQYNELTNIQSTVELFELEEIECPDSATYFYTAVEIEQSCDFADVSAQDLETLKDAFLGTYNNINSLNGRLYDPFFRVIDEVSVVESNTAASVFRYEIRGICNGCPIDAIIVTSDSSANGANRNSRTRHRALVGTSYSLTVAATTNRHHYRHLTHEEESCLRPVGVEEEGIPTEEELAIALNTTIHFVQTLDTTCTVLGLDQAFVPFTWEPFGEDVVVGDIPDSAGTSIALSSDGRTMVIGAPNKPLGTGYGYVQVLRLNDGTDWIQLGDNIENGGDADDFGYDVSISSDGSIMAVGAPGEGSDDQGEYTGVVRVFEYKEEDSSWTQLGQDIYGSRAGDETGFSIDLSGDGMTLVIGAPQFILDQGSFGRVHVWRYQNDGVWEPVGQDIEGDAADDQAGYSVAISEDGYVIAVGIISASDDVVGQAGCVRIYYYEESGDSWIQLGQTIMGDEEGDELGSSVDLSLTGKVVTVAAPEHSNGGLDSVGQVRVYQLVYNDDNNSYEWTQFGQTLYGKGEDAGFGSALSLSDNGMILAAGGYDSNGAVAGYLQIYQHHEDSSDEEWTQLEQDIVGADSDESFVSASLSSNGYIVGYGVPEKGLAKAHYYSPQVDGDLAQAALPLSTSLGIALNVKVMPIQETKEGY